MDYIIGPNLVGGTYTCGLEGGGIEYGFTFTLPFEPPVDQSDVDTEFDVVLGVVESGDYKDMGKVIEQKWEEYKWIAEAIVAAAPPKKETP